MKAIRLHAFGGPEALSYEEVPDPLPGAGQALVRIEAVGVNFIDIYRRTGAYPVELPCTLGSEAAGTVAAVGRGVAGVRLGDRVAYQGTLGSYAGLAVVAAERLVRLPEGVGARQGAAAMLQGMTAHYLACTTRPLGPGDTCLVHAAAGGVGLLLCQIARMRGARVIGTVSTPAKAALAREAHADDVILYAEQDFEAEVRRLTGGAGVQVVYDSVGRTTFEKSLRCLAPRGTLVLFGQSSGPVAPFDPQLLSQRGSLSLTRPSLTHYVATRAELLARAGEVLGWVREGRLVLRVGAELPLEHAAEAHRRLEARATTGKILLIP
ncbi:MAG: NADPH:quinone reductase [Candidatus Eisenbacteria bacterium RBG_16_71_46]|nr:MAG: NADPH:quinone reductase [Candidatus Eisenbacteria bacterium RBG_16_71_46]